MWGKGLTTGAAVILGSLTFHTTRPPAQSVKPLWTVSGPVQAISSPRRYAATLHIPTPKVRFGLTDVRYYVISMPHGPGSRVNPAPLGITVAPGQTVAVREVAANAAYFTEIHRAVHEVLTTRFTKSSPVRGQGPLLPWLYHEGPPGSAVVDAAGRFRIDSP